MTFRLGESIDPRSLGEPLQARGRLQINGFLDSAAAAALHRELSTRRDWRLAANRGEQIIDFGPEMLAAWTAEHWHKLNKAAALGGRFGFQFLYDTIRLPKTAAESAVDQSVLARFADWLCTAPMIDFMRQLTGFDDIGFADAHASRYRPGHFLTEHDDENADMGRRAAYVLNLSPRWRPDWGGLLLFHDSRGNISRGFTPAFNSLNIFKVPQRHSVSWVTPLAAQPRYAITGWLRAGQRP